MEQIFLLALVGLTSLGGYVVGVRRLGLSARQVRAAASKMLEGVGATLCFAIVNLAAAVSIILVVRGLTGRFVSLYLVDDVAWLVLSVLQGLAFQWWRELSRAKLP